MALETLTIAAAQMILSRNIEGLKVVNTQFADLPSRELSRVWKLIKKVLTDDDVSWFHQTLEILKDE